MRRARFLIGALVVAVATVLLGLWVLIAVSAVLGAIALLVATLSWLARPSAPCRDRQVRVGQRGLFWSSRGPGRLAFGLGRRHPNRGWADEGGDWPDPGGVREPRRPTGPGPRGGAVTLDPPG